MARIKRQVSTPERAVELASDAIGEPKEVAVMLWPTKYKHRPESGGDWLGHCLTPERREKLDLCDVVAIFREAASLGEHEGFAAFAAMCGYNATPSDVEAELRRAREEAASMLRAAQQAVHDYDELAQRPELLARMRAANLKVPS